MVSGFSEEQGKWAMFWRGVKITVGIFIYTVALILLPGRVSHAGIFTGSWIGNLPISESGPVTATIDISASGSWAITDLRISLNISGGRNSDISVILRAPGENAPYIYLINRPGRGDPISDVLGGGLYAMDSGFLITISDHAMQDLHWYRGWPGIGGGPPRKITGEFQPDGRNVSPQAPGFTFLLAERVSLAAVFRNVNPVGQWTLELRDWNPAGPTATLNGWTLEITAVPEPVETALMAFTGLLLVGWFVRTLTIRAQAHCRKPSSIAQQ